jgi:hypothetical protein
MDPSLVRLMEELIAAIELRDSTDPDAPAWEAAARIRSLGREITRLLAVQRTAVASGTLSAPVAEPQLEIESHLERGVAGSVQ